MGLLATLARSVRELVDLGYPESVAERIVSGELPMDFESRMARAREQGYDVDMPLYHGTDSDITEFRLAPHDETWMDSVSFAYSPEYASAYATNAFNRMDAPETGGVVYPVFLKGGVRKFMDMPEEVFEEDGLLNPFMKRIGVENVEMFGDDVSTINPSNIRSALSAAFDPEYTGPNILGTTAATAGALGLLASPEEAEAGPVTQAIRGVLGDIDPRYDPRVGSVERLANLEPNIISRGTLDDVPRVSLSSLEGMPFVTTMSDRTRAGGLLAGINDVELDMPVNLQGGQDFMFENSGMVWASAPGVVNQIIRSASEAGENPLYMPFRMAPTGGDFATKTGETLISYASANMSQKDKRALDKAIKEYVTTGKMLKDKETGESRRVGAGLSVRGWKGVDNPESIEVWRNTPDSVRKEIMDKVFDKQFRDKGGLSIGEARLAVSDPRQVGARDAGIQNVGQIFTGQPAITKSGHPSYPAGVPGQGLGRLDDQEMTIFDLIPDARLGKAQRRVADTVDPANPSPNAIRAISMKPYTGTITEDTLKRLEARGINVNSSAMLPALAASSLFEPSQERALQAANEGLLSDAMTVDEQADLAHRRRVNERMSALGLLQDPMYEYGTILPQKTNVATGETSLAFPEFVQGIARGLLDIGSTRDTKRYNPAALLEVL